MFGFAVILANGHVGAGDKNAIFTLTATLLTVCVIMLRHLCKHAFTSSVIY